MSADLPELHAALAAMGPARFLAALGIKSRSNGGTARFACPIHGGKGPNVGLHVHDGRLLWSCFSGCASGGDALTLIAAVHGLDVRADFAAVVREAASIAGVAVSVAAPPTRFQRRDVPEAPEVVAARLEAAEGVRRVLSTLLELCPLTGEGLRYLTEERGLTRSTCESARVGYVSDPDRVLRMMSQHFSPDALDRAGVVYQGDWLAFARHPLLFPILHNGQPVYVQGRAIGAVAKKQDRWRSCRGGVPSLYGVDALDRADVPVVLCEGPIDALSAAQWMPDVASVGVFGAGSFKAEWAAPLRGRDVWVAFDPDAAGDAGAVDVVRVLAKAGAWPKRLALPAGFDVNAWMLAEAA